MLTSCNLSHVVLISHYIETVEGVQRTDSSGRLTPSLEKRVGFKSVRGVCVTNKRVSHHSLIALECTSTNRCVLFRQVLRESRECRTGALSTV